ncbi:MAG: S8 family serine peptidase [Actinomycetota bacterium]|nr:S8 family serine peptidase [Actinomycetota bacterium]
MRVLRKHFAVRVLLLTAAAALALAFAGAASAATYIVLYKAHAVPADAGTRVSIAGGTLVASYGQIGVVIARSDRATFRTSLLKDARIEGVASTAGLGSPLETDLIASHDGDGGPGDLPNAPATDEDETFWSEQWDMRQIQVEEAHAITGGSPAVEVGIIDTGVEPDHPDLATNLNYAKSVSCESGAPDPDPAAWDDRYGHGTHVAGTVAAVDNSVGIIGVAPNVRLVAIKSSNDDGYFFPEMVVCSFMWAGQQRLDVTNNSYFADPFLYNCRNDPVQRAIWKAEMRAIRYAMNQGVTVVAAEGNQSDDLAHPTLDVISPDFPPGTEEEREITNACVVVPVEVPGVIGVTSTGNMQRKAYYSSYGVGVADVTAPGGDRFQVTAEAKNGRVLSTLPAESFLTQLFQARAPHFLHEECGPDGVCAFYGYLQGTSMASPHAAGVAALIVSKYGTSKNPQNGKMRPGQVEQYLQHTADPQPCPTEAELVFYEPFPQTNGEPQACQGGTGYNSWYGSGEVNAFKAVTHTTR